MLCLILQKTIPIQFQRGTTWRDGPLYSILLSHLVVVLVGLASSMKMELQLGIITCLSTHRLYLKVEICRCLSSWRDKDIDFTVIKAGKVEMLWHCCIQRSVYWIMWVNVLIHVYYVWWSCQDLFLSSESLHAANVGLCLLCQASHHVCCPYIVHHKKANDNLSQRNRDIKRLTVISDASCSVKLYLDFTFACSQWQC